MTDDGEPYIIGKDLHLGGRYSCEDMYRDMGIERPTPPEGMEWGSEPVIWSVEIGSAE